MYMKTFFVAACFLAGLMPFIPLHHQAASALDPSFQWPAVFEGRMLSPLPVSKRESEFYENFPGQMKKFSDGEKEIVIRWIQAPTRMLHPSMHCYKGFGYDVVPQPLWLDAQGSLWGCFSASKKGQRTAFVREQIRDSSGKSWPDISAWYWSAVMGKTKGPWQAVTVAAPH
jgi:hypothetical protein